VVVGNSHIDCRDCLVLQELSTRYAPHLKGPQFNDLIAEYKELFTDMVKMLESKAVEVVEDPESEPEVDDEPEDDDKPELKPEVVAELVSL